MASERIEKLLAMQQKSRSAETKSRAAAQGGETQNLYSEKQRKRTHRLCERGGHLEHYLPNPELLTDEDVFLLIDYFFSSPRVRELAEQMTASRRGEIPQSPKELIDAAMQRMPEPFVQSVTWHDADEDDAESDGSSPHPVRAHLYASSMRRAFSEGPCGGARCLRHQQGASPAPIASADP